MASSTNIDVTSRQDLATLRGAINRGFPIDEEIRAAIAKDLAQEYAKLSRAPETKSTLRKKNALAKTLVSMERLNVQVAQTMTDKLVPDLHAHQHSEAPTEPIQVIVEIPSNGKEAPRESHTPPAAGSAD